MPQRRQKRALADSERPHWTHGCGVVLGVASGTGAMEAAVVNTPSPGDRVLGCVNGHFSNHFCRTATALGIEVERLEVPYGAAVPGTPSIAASPW